MAIALPGASPPYHLRLTALKRGRRKALRQQSLMHLCAANRSGGACTIEGAFAPHSEAGAKRHAKAAKAKDVRREIALNLAAGRRRLGSHAHLTTHFPSTPVHSETKLFSSSPLSPPPCPGRTPNRSARPGSTRSRPAAPAGTGRGPAPPRPPAPMPRGCAHGASWRPLED